MHNENQSFGVYSSVSFGICIQLCNHPYNQVIKQFLYLQFSSCSVAVTPCSLTLACGIVWFFCHHSLASVEFYIDAAEQ